MRRLWLFYSAVRRDTLENAKRQVIDGRTRIKFECASCHKLRPKKEVEVDHIHGLISFTYDNMGEWTKQLFFGPQQILCRPCHSAKTKEQAKARTIIRRSKAS